MSSPNEYVRVACLTRSLGLRDVILFFVTAGTNFQWIATAAAAGQGSLRVWVLGGLVMFLPLSVCVVFLSSRHPAQGGLYVWSKLAFGPGVGFMTGWTYWTSNLPFFPGILYFVAGNALYVSPLACVGSVGAWLGAVARIPFVAGIDSFRGVAVPRQGSLNVGAGPYDEALREGCDVWQIGKRADQA